MNYQWDMDLKSVSRAGASSMPPASVEESAWDILLALHADVRCELSLEKLGRVTSITSQALTEKLANLEASRLVTGVRNEVTTEIRALLTPAARRLIDQYLSAANDLQVGAGH